MRTACQELGGLCHADPSYLSTLTLSASPLLAQSRQGRTEPDRRSPYAISAKFKMPGIQNLVLAHNHNDSNTKSRNRIVAGRTKRWATTIAQSWNCIAWSAQSWSLKTEVSGLAKRSGGTNSGVHKIVGVTKGLYSSRCTQARRTHGSNKVSQHPGVH